MYEKLIEILKLYKNGNYAMLLCILYILKFRPFITKRKKKETEDQDIEKEMKP